MFLILDVSPGAVLPDLDVRLRTEIVIGRLLTSARHSRHKSPQFQNAFETHFTFDLTDWTCV